MKLEKSYLLFLKALNQLDKAQQEPYSEFIRDAVIQRFELTYDLAWKTLKAYLASQDIKVLNPKETLKASFEQELIEDAETWGQVHKYRNLTSHTYDELLANDIYTFLMVTLP